MDCVDVVLHWISVAGSFLFFLPWEGYTLVGTTDVKTKPDLHHQVPEDILRANVAFLRNRAPSRSFFTTAREGCSRFCRDVRCKLLLEVIAFAERWGCYCKECFCGHNLKST